MGLEKVVWLAKLQNVKCTVLLLFVLNGTVFGLALWLVSIQNSWPEQVLVVIGILVVVSSLRVFWLGAMGFAQVAVASVMITAQQDKDAQAAAADDDVATQDGSLTQRDRRRRYKQWLWGGRVGFLLACLQVVGAAYLTHIIVEKEYANIHHNGQTGHWQKTVLVILNVFSWAATVVQCCVGSNMMAWHSLYDIHDEAWRAHYREVFNHGIREALCCLGKSRYLSQLKNDEVDSVAALLGDLVAYRAQGASHLEVLAGVAMLKNQPPQLQSFSDKYKPAPVKELLEASILQPYAVAAYTGLLLDIGRNPLIFPCVWLYRQGVLAPWNRNQRPVLQGDNWWRGHAAAFLKHVNLPPEALRNGRVSQVNGEAAYFVVVLRKLRTVLVAIRGTETPEDLLTDGLSQECLLSNTDLLGLLTGPGIDEKVRSNLETMPHYAHIGIVNAARELSKELDNLTEDDNRSMTLNNSSAKSPDHESNNQGLLSKLLGSGGDCKGYKLRLVGHSLGGAIAALTGLRLRGRYPKLRVYAFGVLPCIDAVTAEACESFVTSVVYNDEFSSRLSVASMVRLRTNALNALASDSNSRNSSSRQHSKVMRNQEDSSNSSSSSRSGIQEEEDAMRRSSHGSTVSDSQDSTERVSSSSASPSGRLLHSNLDCFLDVTTPKVKPQTLRKSCLRDPSLKRCIDPDGIPFFSLGDLWDSFDEWSAYGAGVPLMLNGDENVVQYYVPYVSALQLYTLPSRRPHVGYRAPGAESDEGSEASSDGENESPMGLGRSLRRQSFKDSDSSSSCSHMGSGPRLECSPFVNGDGEEGEVWSYFETSPPYSRVPLVDKIADLSQDFDPESNPLRTLRSVDLLPNSWLSVAWYPIYRIPTGPTLRDLAACFLTFHSLSTPMHGASGVQACDLPMLCPHDTSRLALRAFGLASYKLKGALWTSNLERRHATLLQNSADAHLKQLGVQHPDYIFFTSRSNSGR
ncbi:unnamed protein product [Sphagnum jensenii]|uniref:Sn1-specific diacylglycerol lipase beta n=1 Tax=Sphagnum jensenii TaxID=128206 RepID=A0ABP0XHW0_9BRYO